MSYDRIQQMVWSMKISDKISSCDRIGVPKTYLYVNYYWKSPIWQHPIGYNIYKNVHRCDRGPSLPKIGSSWIFVSVLVEHSFAHMCDIGVYINIAECQAVSKNEIPNILRPETILIFLETSVSYNMIFIYGIIKTQHYKEEVLAHQRVFRNGKILQNSQLKKPKSPKPASLKSLRLGGKRGKKY